MRTIELGNLIDNGFILFDFDYPVFDETFRNHLETTITERFWYDEIGQETPKRFKHYVANWFRLNMPIYNKMYESTLYELDPFCNVWLQESFTRKNDVDKRSVSKSSKGLVSDGTNTHADKTLFNESSNKDTVGNMQEDINSNITDNGTTESTKNEDSIWDESGNDKKDTDKTTDSTVNTTGSSTSDTTGENTSSGTKNDFAQDTPQNQITFNISEGGTISGYLTSHNLTTNSDKSNTKGHGDTTNKSDTVSHVDEKTNETGEYSKEGNKGVETSFSEETSNINDLTKKTKEDTTENEKYTHDSDKRNNSIDRLRNKIDEGSQSVNGGQETNVVNFTKNNKGIQNTTVSELLLKYRSTLDLNVTKLICKELEQFFMLIF